MRYIKHFIFYVLAIFYAKHFGGAQNIMIAISNKKRDSLFSVGWH